MDGTPPADISLLPDVGLIPDIGTPDQGTVVPGWINVPPGTFSMGSPSSENCRYANETQHQVTLTHGFAISAFEVTQGQFNATMGLNPSTYPSCGATCAVDSASWDQAAAYCNALSSAAQLPSCYSCSGAGASTVCAPGAGFAGKGIYSCSGYRLPTEAEWEYAYRAGTTTASYAGDLTNCVDDAIIDPIGWYSRNSSGIQPVGTRLPNAWGLYDMAGNLMEWCHDWYEADLGTTSVTDPVGPATGTLHGLRGGSWGYQARALRAAYRITNASTTKAYFIGFRCVRTLP